MEDQEQSRTVGEAGGWLKNAAQEFARAHVFRLGQHLSRWAFLRNHSLVDKDGSSTD